MSTEEALGEVGDRVADLYDLINDPLLQRVLSREPRFGDLCAAKDVIEDSHSALSSFPPPIAEGEKGLGHLYLAIYGLLNVCYAQREALRVAAAQVGLGQAVNADLQAVVRVRNAAAAHSSGNDYDTASFLVQASLSTKRFTILREPTGPRSKIKELLEATEYEVADILAQQARGVCGALDDINAQLRRRAQELRAHWKEREPERIAAQMRHALAHLQGRPPGSPIDRATAEAARSALDALRGTLVADAETFEDRGLPAQIRRVEAGVQGRHLDEATWLGLMEAFDIIDAEHRTEPGLSNSLP